MESKAFLSLMITLLLSTSVAAESYRWKDKSGELHFGASVPAEYADQAYDIISESGLVIGHVEPGSASIEARAAAAKQLELSQKTIEERQAKSDRLLLIKYPTEAALLQAMENELDQVGYDNMLITSSYNNTYTAIADKVRLAADQQRAGIKVSEAQSRDLDQLHKNLEIDKRKLNAISSREDGVREQFAATQVRYLELVAIYNQRQDDKDVQDDGFEIIKSAPKDQN